MNMNATAQMVTTTQVGCGKLKPTPNSGCDWEEELEAERRKVRLLANALHFYRNHDDNGQTATDALRKAGIEK
jgi:hypothetical protein